MGAGRVIAVDKDRSRLEMARAQGAEVINFDEEEPVQTIMELMGNIGVYRVIEAVGVDAQRAHSGPAAEGGEQMEGEFQTELNRVAPETKPQGDTWVPGDAPPQSMLWAAQSVMKAGVIGVIGVFPPQAMTAPIGTIQQRNLTVRGGNCNHRRYMPKLVGLVATGAFDPTELLTQTEPITDAIEAYKIFDRREPG
jgi:threonine dehydrogenase-like Zn-dependent dehydrogenase